MFTGLIEEVGTVTSIDGVSQGSRLTIAATSVTEGMRVGDSIAVDGVCLTAVEVNGGEFVAEVSPETIACSNLVFYQIGTAVNLERPVSAASRLGGHFVQGHVDATTRPTCSREEGDFLRMEFKIPDGFEYFIVEKGSIAVNGVSLTVAALQGDAFEVQLVPHTLQNTNLNSGQRAESVNVEVDILGKYVARFLGERLGIDSGTRDKRSGDEGELLRPDSFIEPAGEGS